MVSWATQVTDENEILIIIRDGKLTVWETCGRRRCRDDRGLQRVVQKSWFRNQWEVFVVICCCWSKSKVDAAVQQDDSLHLSMCWHTQMSASLHFLRRNYEEDEEDQPSNTSADCLHAAPLWSSNVWWRWILIKVLFSIDLYDRNNNVRHSIYDVHEL